MRTSQGIRWLTQRVPLLSPDSQCPDCERVTVCCCKPPRVWDLVSASPGHSPRCGGWLRPGQGQSCSGAWGHLCWLPGEAGGLCAQAGECAGSPQCFGKAAREESGGRAVWRTKSRSGGCYFKPGPLAGLSRPLHPVIEMLWAGRVFGVAAIGVGVERAQRLTMCPQTLPSPVPGVAAAVPLRDP